MGGQDKRDRQKGLEVKGRTLVIKSLKKRRWELFLNNWSHHSESRNKLTLILKNIEWIPRLRNSDLYVSNAKEKVCECNGFP